jgi:DNA-binding transcriptional LysR family regulator
VDRLETMRVFVAVGEAEGFAPAARRLGLTAPAVTRAVAALERRLGTRLLHRTTRIARLTEAGVRYLADCKRILAELEEAESSAAGAHAEPQGQLSVTATVLFGRMHVAPILLDFLARHPRVIGRTLMLDRVVDIIDEGIDVAVRIAHLADSSLSAVRVGEVRRVVCASPAYLARRGAPEAPAEIARHDVIAFAPPSALAEDWTFGAGAVTVTPRARLIVNTVDIALAAAIAGHGLARVFSYQAMPEAAAGRLEVVLAAHEPPPVPVHLVHAEGRRASAKVRAFVDFAAARLRADPALR